MPHTDNWLQIAIEEAKKMKKELMWPWLGWQYTEWKLSWINELIQRLEALAEVATKDDGWISVSERLPEEYGNYIAWWDGFIELLFFWKEKKWYYDDDWVNIWVTHWMNLPLSPTTT